MTSISLMTIISKSSRSRSNNNPVRRISRRWSWRRSRCRRRTRGGLSSASIFAVLNPVRLSVGVSRVKRVILGLYMCLCAEKREREREHTNILGKIRILVKRTHCRSEESSLRECESHTLRFGGAFFAAPVIML
jgi:hypothetical protein